METTTDTNIETTPERKNGIYVDNNGKNIGVVINSCYDWSEAGLKHANLYDEIKHLLSDLPSESHEFIKERIDKALNTEYYTGYTVGGAEAIGMVYFYSDLDEMDVKDTITKEHMMHSMEYLAEDKFDVELYDQQMQAYYESQDD